jgi:hypothetical protein|tara:strand:- start:260 stop:463 length:204 start_codon:yes stop_codon:yes gene_type:complete
MNSETNQTNPVWIKTTEQKLQALLADEAKSQPMLTDIMETVRQLKAKSSFRIALIHQLLENQSDKQD